ncbi:hypothetical protein [Gimesia fumaroli]|uniref:Uncharacterized protein n=1 Tax=Gimesia fumaroli TaxID=2527976 RepID=A0A518IIE3_9PLAN|nr:hypothetical protein [Gimesia fumaroli]QDV52868.1 hypothetical protein Enr17x_49380 [Gimesia fumaroli]
MSINPLEYQPGGDKKNSEFFDEYRMKIYERRQSSGVDDLLKTMRGIVVQVEHGDALPYLHELYLMGPYRYTASFWNTTHKVYVLTSEPEFPRLFVLEPLEKDYEDEITMYNRLYPLSSQKPNARYIGEIFSTKDVAETQKTLESHNIRFNYHHETKNPFFTESHFAFTFPSDFTCNRVGYTQVEIDDFNALQLGTPFELDASVVDSLNQVVEFAEAEKLNSLVLGVDHLATRILAGEREDAILEFLTMSNHYFWGAYNISAMNSSTNVTRNGYVDDDKKSPAKVFTANNTPSFVNSFDNLPMPTEDFVRNYGRRLHHVAYEVVDGNHRAGEKNVDYVVNTLKDKGIPFLAHVVGECLDEPNLKQIFSKHSDYSILITEYVERCHGYEGFFTKSNVAALTEAAGKDERYEHGHVFD